MARKTGRAVAARLALLAVYMLAWARPREFRMGTARYAVNRDGVVLPMMSGGAPRPGESGHEDAEAEAAAAAAAAAEAEAEAGDGDGDRTADDYRRELRRYERESKKRQTTSAKRIEELEADNARLTSATQTDTEAAIEAARREAADAVRAETTSELRGERLTAAVARLAAGRFADVDDALRLLDIDAGDLFDDTNKVDASALGEALDDLLARKPHLAAIPNGGRPQGSADGGKGSGGGRDVGAMSVEDHLKATQRAK